MPSYAIPSHITHQTVDGEVIAIHFGSGTYYSMRESAAVLWEAIVAGHPTESLSAIFSDPPSDAPAQIEAFAGKLLEADLLAPGSGDAPTGSLPTGQPWNAPALEAFDDLSQLLLADPIHDVTEAAWPNLKDPSQA